jgi:hypothetical protein
VADDVVSWEEHAAGLEGEMLALALMRAYLSEDQEDLEVVLDRAYELVLAVAEDEEDTRLGAFESALAARALRWGYELFGDRLDEVLEQMQRDLAAHVANFEPSGAS